MSLNALIFPEPDHNRLHLKDDICIFFLCSASRLSEPRSVLKLPAYTLNKSDKIGILPECERKFFDRTISNLKSTSLS